ncbi:MAG TPA: hypothetical protein PL151_15160 [Phycisphaerae bacterium]|nr:hypothetical protein [Phycisphaerae bacterium]HOJ72328.1 hypothetical protein [Phycisphaerae bacterium]HOM50010.1 hypothetical protein [Phycisphaerae bacterium]HON65345.1 hypothetical protein [Phycisphaerae bacterium]HOQ84742.1 hypothetical protein [Phycisphaerae bacterium]
MPNFGSDKREREYEKLKKRFRKSGRYGNRAEQVAARIVNKQRSQYGETKEEKQKDRTGRSPDRGLPIHDYQRLTVPQIKGKLDGCSTQQLRQIKKYEQSHKARKTLLAEIDSRMK